MHDLAQLLQNLTSGDDEQAERAALALGALGQEALEPLLGLLRAGDVEARWWSARTLALIRHPQATQALITCLADPDAGVRQCALRALAEAPTPLALAGLLERLGDPDELSSRLAGEVLARVGTEALGPLIARLREGSARERIGAARALADMRRPEAIEALFSALEDESTLVRHWVQVGLERLGQDFVFFLP